MAPFIFALVVLLSCYNTHAKDLGDSCYKTYDQKVDECGSGLRCMPRGEMQLFGWGTCHKDYQYGERSLAARTLTKCEQDRRTRLISMVVWQGMWIPKCDAVGNFLPQQCDNTGSCFCVDKLLGQMDDTSKVQGPATCH